MNEQKPNIVRDKSFAFAVRIVNLYKHFSSDKKEFIMSKLLMRSGTSVGANVREGVNAQSKKDFIHKLSIAQKECNESTYWLELQKETEYINTEEYNSLANDATELLKIIRSIIITTKRNYKL